MPTATIAALIDRQTHPCWSVTVIDVNVNLYLYSDTEKLWNNWLVVWEYLKHSQDEPLAVIINATILIW